jgi:ATP synthase F1 delta subunit
LLASPAIPKDRRKAVAEKAFGPDSGMPKEFLNLLRILIDKRRIGMVGGVYEQFRKYMDKDEGLTEGTIESAVPLTKKQIEGFEAETARLLGAGRVKLSAKVDPAVLGGVRIYIDGKLIDASLRKKLDELKEILCN